MTMKKRTLWILSILFITAAGVGAALSLPRDNPPPTAPDMVGADPSSGQFARADGPREWHFPEDFGPHPSFQTEWWYYTGNLQSEEGQRFGYMLTIFRRGLLPPQEQPVRASNWAASEVYMGHFALTDINGKEHHSFERFSRGAAGLAGAASNPLHVWLENWDIQARPGGATRLQAEAQGIKIDLLLQDDRGIILHGEEGYSQKGLEAGNASYYFSQTRLETSGKVSLSGHDFPVHGLSWMDHEFSTNALSQGQVGWDWFSLQLEDGTDLMVYRIRRRDGSASPFSSGTLILPGDDAISLNPKDYIIEVHDTWRSPHTGAEYPSSWTVSVPSHGLKLEVEPVLANQEMDVSYVYWEGAVQVSGQHDGQATSGRGYVELTGYLESLEGDF